MRLAGKLVVLSVLLVLKCAVASSQDVGEMNAPNGADFSLGYSQYHEDLSPVLQPNPSCGECGCGGHCGPGDGGAGGGGIAGVGGGNDIVLPTCPDGLGDIIMNCTKREPQSSTEGEPQASSEAGQYQISPVMEGILQQMKNGQPSLSDAIRSRAIAPSVPPVPDVLDRIRINNVLGPERLHLAGLSDSPPQMILIDRNAHENGKKLVDKGSFCPDQDRWPWQASREDYFARRDMQQCTWAYYRLANFDAYSKMWNVRKYEEKYRRKWNPNARPIGYPVDGLLNPQSDQHLMPIAEWVFRGYSEKCLRNIDDLTVYGSNMNSEKSNFLNKAFHYYELDALQESIGLFKTHARDRFECSGAIASINGVPYLTSAMHCLGRIETATDGMTQLASVHPYLTFTTYAGRTFELAVSDDLIGVAFELERDDLFAVEIPDESFPELAGAHPRPMLVPIATLPLEPWEPMLIIGFNAYMGTIAELDGIQGMDLMHQSIAVETGADCQVRASSRGKLRYQCQTAARMSGAPIFAWRDFKFVLAGVHVGDAGSHMRPLSCDSGSPVGGINRGISIRFP